MHSALQRRPLVIRCGCCCAVDTGAVCQPPDVSRDRAGTNHAPATRGSPPSAQKQAVCSAKPLRNGPWDFQHAPRFLIGPARARLEAPHRDTRQKPSRPTLAPSTAPSVFPITPLRYGQRRGPWWRGGSFVRGETRFQFCRSLAASRPRAKPTGHFPRWESTSSNPVRPASGASSPWLCRFIYAIWSCLGFGGFESCKAPSSFSLPLFSIAPRHRLGCGAATKIQ